MLGPLIISGYEVLAGSTVSNLGASNIDGSVGVYPGSDILGFPPGVMTNGMVHAGDAAAMQAQLDFETAYNAAAA